MAFSRLHLLSLLALATAVAASSDEYGGSSSSSSSSSGSSSAAAAAAAAQAAADVEAAIEKAHGVLGCLAFAFFFPVGGIIIRLLPGRLSVWLHALWQIFGWLCAVATLAMGIWMAKGTEYIETNHAIIGIFVVAAVSLQPVTGLLHHLMFKRARQRTLWSYAHMFWGIPVITLGAINGGLGLELNGAEQKYMIVYGVFAALIWVVWMAVSVLAQIRRGRSTTVTKQPDDDTERMASSDGQMRQTVPNKESRDNYE